MARIRHHLKNAFIPHHGNDYRPHALRRPWLHTYAAIIVGVKVLTILVIGFYASLARVSDLTPSAIITLTNQARQQRKVAVLKTNPLLTKAADSKAADMARQNYFAHISPTGTTPWAWFKKAGYSYTYAGENLALDFISSEDVIAAWLKSPSHRSNLLSAKFKDIGVAVVNTKINGADSIIVVQMFGAPVPLPTSKTIAVPAQTPLPAQAKQQLAQTPPTKVLGEVTALTPPTAPDVPMIVTPEAASIVRTNQPEVVGRAEPGSTVTLFVNGIRTATATADVSGLYSVTPSQPLSDGPATVQTTATARGLTSSLSPARSVTFDTQAPAIEVQRSIVLPSYLDQQAYDVAVTVTGQPSSVRLTAGGQATPLTLHGQVYAGTIRLAPSAVAGVLTISAVDVAGNQVKTVLADPTIFTTGVVADTGGPFVAAVRLLFYSRAFLAIFLALIFISATLNIVVQWRHQHHPTIIMSLLVVFLGGALLVM